MKKTSKIICLICAVVLLAVLFVPFSVNYYEDGGTVKITALTYSVVKWEKLMGGPIGEDGVMLYMETYENTCVYLFPNNFKALDELWVIRH